jgi:hypothetical protein
MLRQGPNLLKELGIVSRRYSRQPLVLFANPAEQRSLRFAVWTCDYRERRDYCLYKINRCINCMITRLICTRLRWMCKCKVAANKDKKFKSAKG